MLKYLILSFFIFFAFSGMAQYSFKGKVLDEFRQPLSGITVVLGKNLQVAITDSAGNYHFNFTSNTYLLSFSHVEFFPKSIMVNGKLPVSIILNRNNEMLNETVVHAFERNSSFKNAPAAITVLNKNLIQRLGTSSLIASFNNVTGVKMDERSPGSYRLSIRGNLLRSTFGVRNVKIYWNGIPFTDANGNTYLNQLSTNNISKVEIIKGPSGSMYGSGTGGVVLLSTGTNASLKEKSLEIQAVAGSYGLLSAQANFQSSGKNQSTFSLSHLQSDGYRNHTEMRRDVVQYTGSFPLSIRRKINANVFYSNLYYQTPGGLTKAELDLNPKQARPAAGVFQSAETQKAAIYLKTIYTGLSQELKINNRWHNTTGIYGSYTDFNNPTIRNFEDKYEKGLGARTVFQYKAGFLTTTFGAEWQQGFFNTAVYNNNAGEKNGWQYTAKVTSKQYNIFLQTDFALPANWLLSAGLSYNNFYYSFQKASIVSSWNESSLFKPTFVPRISLLKKIKRISLYTAVSGGYSVPSIDEVFAGNDEFNKSLFPETAINYETGIKTDILKNKLWLDASCYYFSLKNTIVSRRDSSGGDYYSNAGKTKQLGAELSVHYLPINNQLHFVRQLKVSLNFTSIHAKFVNYRKGTIVYDGNQLTGTAPHVILINADIVTSKKLYMNITYSYTDHIPLNDANSFYARAYQLFFAKLGYKLAAGPKTELHFFTTLEKSFNNPYSLGNDLNAAANRYFNPSAPQQFSAGIQCRFIKNKPMSKLLN